MNYTIIIFLILFFKLFEKLIKDRMIDFIYKLK